MTAERQETRAEEVARVRSYLASQSMRRTPAQLVETLQEAHQQFLAAVATVPDALFRTTPREGEWSAIDVLLHVRTIAAIDDAAITAVLERGEQPPDIEDTIVPAPLEITRTELLADLERFRKQLIAVVLQADPEAHLDITWSHREFGPMHWREWLLFARVHTLDHAHQIQAIAATLVSPGEGAGHESGH
jgi:DinB superfamily